MRERVEGPVRAEGVLPEVEAEVVAVAPVGLEPRFEDRRLGVDDQPVEIEDDGPDRLRQGSPAQRRAPASLATRAFVRS